MFYNNTTGAIFSQQEKKQILEQLGFTVETITSWESVSNYHGRNEYEDKKVVVAYYNNERPDSKELERDSYSLTSRYGIEKAFNEVCENRLKKVLFPELNFAKNNEN